MARTYYKDLEGKLWPYEELADSYSWERWGIPFPFLMMLAEKDRERYCDFSVSELAGDPQQVILRKHKDRILIPRDELWKVTGTGVHVALERGNTGGPAFAEGKVVVNMEMSGDFAHAKHVVVGGTYDYYDPNSGIMDDWKNTSVWKVKRIKADGLEKAAPEWHMQLRMYRALIMLSDYSVPIPTKLRLTAVARDWRPGEAKRYGDKYPDRMEHFIAEETSVEDDVALLVNRVQLFVSAETRFKNGLALPECDDLWGTENGLPKRCMNYCSVSDSCDQLRRLRNSR